MTPSLKPGKNAARLRHGARLTERSRSDGNYTDLTSDGRTGGTRGLCQLRVIMTSVAGGQPGDLRGIITCGQMAPCRSRAAFFPGQLASEGYE